MREMSLDRLKQLLIGATCELRPALASSDPSLPFIDRGHIAWFIGVQLISPRPVEDVGKVTSIHGRERCRAGVSDTFPKRFRGTDPFVRTSV
jgi:hypothetical protein